MPRPLHLRPFFTLAVALSWGLACSCSKENVPQHASPPVQAPLSVQADREMLTIPAGGYVEGSTPEEREQAYADYLATAGRDSARRGAWFQYEVDAHEAQLPGYAIDKHPVTQAAFAEFVVSQKRAGPTISKPQWQAQGFVQDYEREVRRYNWRGQQPPPNRGQHPVVLVTHAEAEAYCQWRGRIVGSPRALPTASQFEKAARGPNGAPYPFGQRYDPNKLNSADAGPRDTLPVGSHADAASAFGAQEMAGDVFQWTSTPWPHSAGRMTVKGSAWDDHGGLGRAAAAHGRRPTIRHAIVGFRCATPIR